MARAERPASESYQSVCCSVGQSLSYSSTAAIEKVEDEGDHLPIFSLSKSSMDVVMATGPPHKRDPAWTGIDLRRSSSTNTHTEQIQYTLQQQHPEGRQQAGGLQSSLAYQNPGAPSPTGLNERWIANMPRWSRCSSSTHSRSSTPDTIVWRGGSSRPCSLTQELQCSSAPDSPMSKLASPPTTPSPFISPLMTPTLALQDPLALSTHQQDASATASASPPTPSQQAKPASPAPADCNDLLLPSSTEDEAFLENNMLSFQFPSPVPSSVSLQKAASPDPGCFLNSFIDGLTSVEGAQSPKLEELTSTEQLYGGNMPNSVAEEQESDREAFACLLELPWQPVQTCSDGQSCRPHLISSLSDSRLGESCRCNCSHREATTKVDISRKEGNMTTQRDVADASVQTMSPVGSWWDLRRNTSNMGSHSILGSPPGSRLNLKSSVGSNSNLVSPSSSMFPMSDGEDGETQADDPRWDINSASSHDLDRRRSCLKIQGEEREELGRRSSMKQVQWDEDGMTWDVHGASVDPVVLSTAIQKHLELQNGPKPPQQSSKKKKAPQPPILSNVVKAIVTKPETPVMITTSMYTADCVNKASPEEDRQREVEEEAGGKTEEPADAAPETTGAKGSNTKEAEDEEVCGEEGTSYSKSPSRGSAISRKKSVIRSLRRPGWCVSSRKADD